MMSKQAGEIAAPVNTARLWEVKASRMQCALQCIEKLEAKQHHGVQSTRSFEPKSFSKIHGVHDKPACSTSHVDP